MFLTKCPVQAVPVKEKPLVDFSRDYCFSELLPFDFTKKRREVVLSTELEEYRLLIAASREAIETFSAGDLIKFDSFVGENACQVRAIWIALLSLKKPDFTGVYNKLTNIELGIQMLFQSMAESDLNTKWSTLNELLEGNDLLASISFDLYFIIQSFVLAAVRIQPSNPDVLPALCCPVKSNPKNLKRFGATSSMFLGKLIRKYRKFMADASVQFIRDQADELEDANLIKMLSPQFTMKHNDHLSCTPMFWSYQSILSTALKEGIPLIIRVKFLRQESAGYRVIDEDCLFFQPESGGSKIPNFIQRDVTESDYEKPALVIQGISLLNQDEPLSKKQWRTSLLKYSVVTAVLAGAADHPQYPCSEQSAEQHSLIHDLEYEGYKSFARLAGFALDNPSTFFIRHVYASKVKH